MFITLLFNYQKQKITRKHVLDKTDLAIYRALLNENNEILYMLHLLLLIKLLRVSFYNSC